MATMLESLRISWLRHWANKVLHCMIRGIITERAKIYLCFSSNSPSVFIVVIDRVIQSGVELISRYTCSRRPLQTAQVFFFVPKKKAAKSFFSQFSTFFIVLLFCSRLDSIRYRKIKKTIATASTGGTRQRCTEQINEFFSVSEIPDRENEK